MLTLTCAVEAAPPASTAVAPSLKKVPMRATLAQVQELVPALKCVPIPRDADNPYDYAAHECTADYIEIGGYEGTLKVRLSRVDGLTIDGVFLMQGQPTTRDFALLRRALVERYGAPGRTAAPHGCMPEVNLCMATWVIDNDELSLNLAAAGAKPWVQSKQAVFSIALHDRARQREAIEALAHDKVREISKDL
jgi:hypothetical protein